MKKLVLLSAVFAISFNGISQSQQTISVPIKKTGTVEGVDVSTDDAEQVNDEMDKLYDDDLDAGWEGDDFNIVTTGLRFTEVNIPQGATIDSAWIQIYAHEEEADPTTITIWGEDADNSVTFDTINLITDRPATTASVTWDLTETWAIWTEYRTPYITDIIQEIVDRSGWVSGNALALVLEGEDLGASAEDNARDFESFENEEDPDDGGDGLNHPERVPTLIVHFNPWPVGVKENATSASLTIYPNPSADKQASVHVLSLAKGERISLVVCDLTGRAVLETTANNGSSVDISNLGSGVYVVRVAADNASYTQQLVIK